MMSVCNIFSCVPAELDATQERQFLLLRLSVRACITISSHRTQLPAWHQAMERLVDQPWADLYIHKKPPDRPTDPTRPTTDRDKLLQSYISAKNKDNDMKLSGYDPWGLPRSSMLPRMTLSSKSPIRNPQRPPRAPPS